MLYIFGGLPGTGKTTLSKYLAKKINAVYLRIDSIEQAMKNHGIIDIYDQGYQVAFELALENLKLNMHVISDSTNPVNVSRELWRKVAKKANVPFVEIEIFCSNSKEHKERIASRETDIEHLKLPSWKDVTSREYDDWITGRKQIDTSNKTIEESKLELLEVLGINP